MPVSSPAIVPKKKAAKRAPAGMAEWSGDTISTNSGTKFYRCEPSFGSHVDAVSTCLQTVAQHIAVLCGCS